MTGRARGNAAPSPSEPRIRGVAVPALLPRQGAITAMLYGEAPGPRGADKSGFPFFGDQAGLLVYGALQRLDRVTLPAPVEELDWDGARLLDAGIRPVVREVGLSNAYPACPTDDGMHFRAPKRRELVADDNLRRVHEELDAAAARGLTTIIALGAVAHRFLSDDLGLGGRADVRLLAMPHPSPLGLLAWARAEARAGGGAGGASGADIRALRTRWIATLVAHLEEA